MTEQRCLPNVNFDLNQSVPDNSRYARPWIGWIKGQVWQKKVHIGKIDTSHVQPTGLGQTRARQYGFILKLAI